MKNLAVLAAVVAVLIGGMVAGRGLSAAPGRAPSVAMESASLTVDPPELGWVGGVAAFESECYPEVRHVTLTIRALLKGDENVNYRVSVRMGEGPSGYAGGEVLLVQGTPTDTNGEDETRVYTVEFDAQRWAIFPGDTSTNRFEAFYTATYPSLR